MLNDLNKKRHLIIILLLGFSLVLFLATRPKMVINKENQIVQQKSSTTSSNNTTAKHSVSIPIELKEEIDKLKAELGSEPKSNGNIFIEIAALYYKASLYDSSGFYYEKVANLNPTELNWLKAGESYYQASGLALNPENIEQAIQKTRFCYNKVLSISPNNLLAKTNLAMTYVGGDNPMKSIGMLREVLEVNPRFVPAIMSLGGLSMKSGQFEKAVTRFQNVLEIDPKNVQARLGLGYSFIELNKKEEAKKVLTSVLGENIDNVTKEEVLKTLNSLK